MEGSPAKELPFLTLYERNLVGYWIEAGFATQTANGPTSLTWAEIDAWARRFYTEQYIEWVEHPRPTRTDGLADERYKVVLTPIRTDQCVISDWELQMIRKMSSEYVAQWAEKSPYTPCPTEIDVEEMTEEAKRDNSDGVVKSLKAMFGAEQSKSTQE